MKHSHLLTLLACLIAGSVTVALTQNRKDQPAQPAAARDAKSVQLELVLVATQGSQQEDRFVDLSATPEQIANRVRELETKGQLESIERIRLNVVEDHEALLQSGRQVPLGRGPVPPGDGRRPRQAPQSVQYVQVGTLVSAVAKSIGETIAAELKVERSSVPTPPEPPANTRRTAPVDTFTAQTVLRVPAGKTVLVGSSETKSNGRVAQQLILVTVRLDAPQAAPRGARLIDRLKQKVDVRFRRTPLQEALELLFAACDVEYEIDRNGLKAAGLTVNMPQEADLGSVPAIDGLRRILERYRQEGMILVLDDVSGKAIVTTREAAKSRGQTPHEFKR